MNVKEEYPIMYTRYQVWLRILRGWRLQNMDLVDFRCDGSSA